MALDPNIILQGQPVNVMGAISAGNQAAAETNALRQQNALAQIYQEYGPGIMQGQQPALNALARMDPAAALGVQDARLGMDQTRQDMQFTRQKMDFLTAEERRAAEEYARGLSAAEAEAEAAKIEGAVKMGMGLKTPQEWDAFMSQNSPDLVGQFGNRQAIANKYMSMADILKAQQPADPTSGAPSGYKWTDPQNRGAGVTPLPGYTRNPGVVINTGENSSAFAKKSDETAATRYGDIVSAGQNAQAFMGDLQSLATLAGQIGTGKGAQVLAAIGPYAEALGVQVDGLTEMQAFEAIRDRLVPQMRTPGAGATSDFDARMFLNSLPTLAKTPEGNQIVLDTLAAVQQHKMAAAAIANRVFSGEITWQQGDAEIAKLGNPYDTFNASRDRIGGNVTAPRQTAPMQIDGFTIEGLD